MMAKFGGISTDGGDASHGKTHRNRRLPIIRLHKNSKSTFLSPTLIISNLNLLQKQAIVMWINGHGLSISTIYNHFNIVRSILFPTEFDIDLTLFGLVVVKVVTRVGWKIKHVKVTVGLKFLGCDCEEGIVVVGTQIVQHELVFATVIALAISRLKWGLVKRLTVHHQIHVIQIEMFKYVGILVETPVESFVIHKSDDDSFR